MQTITGTIVGIITEIRPSFTTNKGTEIQILKIKEPGGIITYPQLHNGEHLLKDFKLQDKVIVYVKAFGKEKGRNQYHTLVIKEIEAYSEPIEV